MRPGEWAKRWRRKRAGDEKGAELVEFAIVSVLLVSLVYGLVFYGLLFGAHVTLTQAAADGARAGIVHSTANSAITAAEATASSDVAWFGQGPCEPTGTVLTCVATVISCPSNNVTLANNSCLQVTVTYNNYAKKPIIPAALGLGILAPNNLVSTSTLQMSSNSSGSLG